jgi:hypothetical protein
VVNDVVEPQGSLHREFTASAVSKAVMVRRKVMTPASDWTPASMKVFVPFSESLLQETGLGLGNLVPFKLEYECLRYYGWESVEVEEPDSGANR